MEDFVAYNSRKRLAVLSLIAAGFVGLGLWMGGAFGAVPSSSHYSDELTVGIGWFTVLFAALCGLVAIRRCFDPRAQLWIGLGGIRWMLWSDSTIPWSEIADVTTWSFNRQKTIVLHLRDPARFPGKGIPRIFAGMNRLITGGDISITLAGTDQSFDEAMAAMARYRS